MKMQVNAERIKQLREERCWSQSQLAEMAGISLRTLQRVEARSVASLETVKGVASVLNVDCATLGADSEDEMSALTEGNEPPSSVLPERDQVTVSEKRKWWTGVLILISANIVAIVLLFVAHEQSEVSDSTFTSLKALLSVSLLGGVAGAIYQGIKRGIISLRDLY